MNDAQIQDIANTLSDAAYCVRTEPDDLGSVVGNLEGVLEQLRALEGQNLLEAHSQRP